MEGVYKIAVANVDTNVAGITAHVKYQHVIYLWGFYFAPVRLVLIYGIGNFFHVARMLISPKIIRYVYAHLAVVKVHQSPAI